MKRIIIIAAVLFAGLTFNLEARGHYNGVSGYFYSELAPYGSWIEIDYGVVVWRPTIIRRDWMPYTMGRWIWTYDGWYWDSYEPFGHVTFHYGRWFYDDYYGWLWYPDYEWAPAWVEWRYDNSYIGWAPLHPYAFFSVSIGIHFTTVYKTPYYHWHFVNYNHFCHPNVYNYYVGPGYRQRIYSGTKYRTNYRFRDGRIQNRGIDVDFVRNRSGQEIKQRDLVRVRDSKVLKRDSYGKRDEIRTLDLKRDELVRNDLSRMEIKRENRSTNLDLKKVEIGRRDISRDDNRSDRNKERMDNTRNIDKNRQDNSRQINTRTQRESVEKNRTETKRNTEFKSDRNVKRNENVNKEVIKNDRTIERNKNNNDRIQFENKTRVNDNTKKNETREFRTPNRENRTEVKRENTKTTRNDQVRSRDVKEKVNTNTNRSRNNDSRNNTSRTDSKDNKREVKRR